MRNTFYDADREFYLPAQKVSGARAKDAATVAVFNRHQYDDGRQQELQHKARLLPERQLIDAIAHDENENNQRQMEREILDVADQEKARLGRELHDGLCQNLTGIAALSATLSRKLATRSGPAAAEAAEITRLLNETIGHARDLARGLDPVGLERIGLAAALEAFATNVQDLFRVSCRFECDRALPALGPGIERHLYRIAQQAVNNAITHGRATRIDIGLRLRDGKGCLRILDDGVGISKKALAAKGIGLHTMNYRSHAIGASLQVQRLGRRGTAVTCVLCLPSDSAEGPA